jgi:hypothetical protein
MVRSSKTEEDNMTAPSLSLSQISDALGSDLLAYRSLSGSLGISIDDGETVIARNVCRAPVSAVWEEDEESEDLALSELSQEQIAALEGLVALRASAAEASERCLSDRRARAARRRESRLDLDDLGSLYAEISALLRVIAAVQ